MGMDYSKFLSCPITAQHQVITINNITGIPYSHLLQYNQHLILICDRILKNLISWHKNFQENKVSVSFFTISFY